MSGSTTHPLFIGYATLEEFVAVVDPTHPIFANLITEPGRPGQHDSRTDQLVILAAQPGGDDLVHYCRVVVEQLRYVAGQPFDADTELRRERAAQAWGIVREWLNARGLAVQPGVIAVPMDLRLMSGWAGCLEFDRQEQRFVAAG
jgi:hypothetical protein